MRELFVKRLVFSFNLMVVNSERLVDKIKEISILQLVD